MNLTNVISSYPLVIPSWTSNCPLVNLGSHFKREGIVINVVGIRQQRLAQDIVLSPLYLAGEKPDRHL